MLLKSLLVLAILYLVIVICSDSVSNAIIFPTIPSSYEDDDNTLKLETRKGAKITIRYLEAPESRQLMIYSHGNGEDMGRSLNHLKEFQKRGISVLVYDYPGYGTSSHKPSEDGVYAAADAVYTFATETLNFAPGQIVLYGYSLGSGPSCWLAERYPIGRLILDSAFTSSFRVVTKIKLLPVDKFDNLNRLKTIECPTLLIHGTQDQVVPFWHAEKNWKVLHGEKQTLWVEGAGHNNIPNVAGPLYWKTIISFIKQPNDIEQTSK